MNLLNSLTTAATSIFHDNSMCKPEAVTDCVGVVNLKSMSCPSSRMADGSPACAVVPADGDLWDAIEKQRFPAIGTALFKSRSGPNLR